MLTGQAWNRRKNSLWGKLKLTLNAAKHRAKQNNIPFNLDVSILLKIFEKQNGLCAVTGLAFSNDQNPYNHVSPYALSLDRIKPRLGYIKGNVQFVLMAVNMAKSDWTINELKPIWKELGKLADGGPANKTGCSQSQ